VPAAEDSPSPAATSSGARPKGARPKAPRRLRCEGCLEVIALRHAWDTRACGCGALLLSGRPGRPTIHWLSRPGGGWTDLGDEPDIGAETDDDQGNEGEEPARRLGFAVSPPVS
jgi:hypothetical protein